MDTVVHSRPRPSPWRVFLTVTILVAVATLFSWREGPMDDDLRLIAPAKQWDISPGDPLETKIQLALDRVRRILEAERRGSLLPADQVSHSWGDKYRLVEWLTDTMLAAVFESLSRLGLTRAQIRQLLKLGQRSGLYLELTTGQRCSLKQKIEGAGKSHGWMSDFMSTRVKTSTPQWTWVTESHFNISIAQGSSQDQARTIQLMSRTGKAVMTTTTDTQPADSNTEDLAVDISWLFQNLKSSPSGELSWGFSIPREIHSSTPRRNPQISHILEGTAALSRWMEQLKSFLQSRGSKTMDLSAVSGFSPILPLFRIANSSVDTVLNATDTNMMLSEAEFEIDRAIARLSAPGPGGHPIYPPGTGTDMFSIVEAGALLALEYSTTAMLQHRQALDFVEHIIYDQLVAALGSEVSTNSLDRYLIRHYSRLFSADRQPQPFSHAVRSSAHHSPEGTVSIESLSGEPLYMFSSSGAAAEMSFRLDASTKLEFRGQQQLHAYLDHSFAAHQPKIVKLVARARQFSCMIVLLGRILNNHQIDPVHAVIVQNKDDLEIPLELLTIPTPQAFKEAIQSLSPSQQAFAQSMRSLQLETTLFGVLVIQIKPQLERVLQLPARSLTKELQLTQDLMALLVEQEIPTEMVSYSGGTLMNCSEESMVRSVQRHVDALKAMIDNAKALELTQHEQQRTYDATTSQRPNTIPHRQTDSEESHSADSDLKVTIDRDNVISSPAPHHGSHGGALSGELMGGRIGGLVNPRQYARSPARSSGAASSKGARTSGDLDYTAIAAEMDKRIEQLDPRAVLRPAVIHVQQTWKKRSRVGLLGAIESTSFGVDQQNAEKRRAFRLLDALTRGGAAKLEETALHVVVAATHQFDKGLMQTVVQDNVNPIERLESSALGMASVVHRVPIQELVSSRFEMERVRTGSPWLFEVSGNRTDWVSRESERANESDRVVALEL